MTEFEIERRDKDIAERVKRYGEKLYHYTSISAFYGMINNKELWLGNTATMNDRLKLVGFIEGLKNAISEVSNGDTGMFYNDFWERVYQRLENEYPFAACFSKLMEDAAQWERYADNARGVCIEFDAQKIMSLFYCQSSCMFNEVFYNGVPKEHELYNILLNSVHDKSIENERSIVDQILGVAGLHKHNSFSNEAEIRLICLWGNCIEHASFDYVLINGLIRKIMKVNLNAYCEETEIAFEDLISKIIIGPRSQQNINELKQFLISRKHEKLAEVVTQSYCPLR